MEFRMEIGLKGKVVKKIFHLHELMGGSNVALSEVIEGIIINNVDREIEEHLKGVVEDEYKKDEEET